jgi:hypothetical protein
MTPGEIVRILTAAGGTYSAHQRDGDLRLDVACPGGLPAPLTRDLLKDHKSALIELSQLEVRLRRGMNEFLLPMEASGQMATGKYSQRLRQWEAPERRYMDVWDGLVSGKAGAA